MECSNGIDISILMGAVKFKSEYWEDSLPLKEVIWGTNMRSELKIALKQR